jgi:hypothetical protein
LGRGLGVSRGGGRGGRRGWELLGERVEDVYLLAEGVLVGAGHLLLGVAHLHVELASPCV